MDPRVVDTNARYHGLPPRILMENAGRGIADLIMKSHVVDSIAIVCGTGNNGGDGFVVARHLEQFSDIDVILPMDPSSIRTEEAKENFELLSGCDVKVISTYKPPDMSRYDLIVDAMLGTGAKGSVREPYASYVNAINCVDAIKVSIDVESGNGGDISVRSDYVISLHNAKQENAKVLPIGIPRSLNTTCGPGNVKYLSRRTCDAHKGDGGVMAVVGGSERYHGAPSFASLAGARLCDLVYVICPESVHLPIRCMSPELIVEWLPGKNLDDSVTEHPRLGEVDCILCGVGAGRADHTMEGLRKLYERARVPMVIDADGLHALKGHLDILREGMCITPHAREFASLFGELPAELSKRRKTVEGTAEEYGCAIVLKGMCDIISSKGETWVNSSGNEGMTTGGTGDVLAGCITAFATKNDLFESALASTFAVGLAGDMAREVLGRHYTASDVIENLANAVKFCEDY